MKKTPEENSSPATDENWLDAIELELSRREFMTGAVAAGVVATMPSLPVFAKAKGGTPSPASPSTLPTTFPPVELDIFVNGKAHHASIDPRMTLLDFVREELKMTGSKKGCDHGQCGACTVLVDGKRINSCLSLAAQNHGKHVTTIEGLASADRLHPMQAAFVEHDAFQCGFCTPGQIMSAVALLDEPVGHSEPEVREAMSGNICRCGAYRNILDAISAARGNGKA